MLFVVLFMAFCLAVSVFSPIILSEASAEALLPETVFVAFKGGSRISGVEYRLGLFRGIAIRSDRLQ